MWFSKSKFQQCLEQAEQGNSIAQNNLGYMYDLGQGVTQNLTEAAKWYRKSAEQGNASGQVNLGNMYAEGSGVPQDYSEAAKWLMKAAEQGTTLAQGVLGTLYFAGHGVPVDYIEAYKWLNLSIAHSADDNRNKFISARDYCVFVTQMTPAQIAEAQKRAREWKPTK
jgi:hypothetical protein